MRLQITNTNSRSNSSSNKNKSDSKMGKMRIKPQISLRTLSFLLFHTLLLTQHCLADPKTQGKNKETICDHFF